MISCFTPGLNFPVAESPFLLKVGFSLGFVVSMNVKPFLSTLPVV